MYYEYCVNKKQEKVGRRLRRRERLQSAGICFFLKPILAVSGKKLLKVESKVSLATTALMELLRECKGGMHEKGQSHAILTTKYK